MDSLANYINWILKSKERNYINQERNYINQETKVYIGLIITYVHPILSNNLSWITHYKFQGITSALHIQINSKTPFQFEPSKWKSQNPSTRPQELEKPYLSNINTMKLNQRLWNEFT